MEKIEVQRLLADNSMQGVVECTSEPGGRMVLTFVRQCGSLSDPSSTPVTRNQEGKKRPFRGLVKASTVCNYAAEEVGSTMNWFKDQHLVSSLLIKKHST
jgi:hypothetical protein